MIGEGCMGIEIIWYMGTIELVCGSEGKERGLDSDAKGVIDDLRVSKSRGL